MTDYKGYRAAVTFDADAGIFHGEVVGTRDVITFAGTSVAELEREFRFSVDDNLAVCAERGRRPDKPFSGKIPLRVSPEIHRAAALAAKAQGTSLNAWLAETVARATSS
ncbi:MAG: type II toxin-antitoxin system HicB family antitoxin [Alphaproteobacteria bacterium]|nr:type II toxin-antitoxin system HicB family antitoxin [Alphaproteobacteria bacterium]